MGALVGLVEFLGERRAEGAIIFAAEGGWGEASGDDEAEDFVEVVQEDGLVAGLDGVREDIFGSDE